MSASTPGSSPGAFASTACKYEDINGNGELDVTDIQALYANKDATVVQSNTEAFDFNNDGNVDILDVQALFYEHTDG